jgi:[glutamine synthetase] adenylyltransferase / [glutamine synthetase]-adenylyl-L-tyrosine phosphorylase
MAGRSRPGYLAVNSLFRGGRPSPGPVTSSEYDPLVTRVAEPADPERARVALSRLGERAAAEVLARGEIREPLLLLLGFSTAAADFFVAHPEELATLADTAPRWKEALSLEAAGDVSALGAAAGLRRFRRRAGYRVAARDLGGAPVEEVMAELTAIAEVCLEAAVAAVQDGGMLAVVGMGKLGGRELNYASDVDVIFVHREFGPEAMQRAGRAASAVIDLLSAPGPEGIALRVDPDLRPEGRAGTLSRSLEGMADYYEQHAATWERQALLKARPVAGDPAVGNAFVERVTPLVFPSVLPVGAVDDVRASKARIEEHVRAAGKESVELKRGRGGIRDVEFAVQLLQLVHGGRNERVREPNTLRALTILADEGFVRRRDADVLADSYRFLRRLEHRLQMVRDLQTHELPRDPAAQLTLARSMGLPDAAALLAEYARTTDVVRGLHERLFYRPLVEALGTSAPPPGEDRASTEELLAALGFADPPAAYRLLVRVADPSTRLGKVIDALFPVIGPALAAATPDAALVRFARVAEQHRDDDDVADALAERPDAARRLAALTGASSAFADALVARPALITSLYRVPLPEQTLFRGDADGDLIRVAGAYAAGEVAVADLGGLLSAVAEGVIARAVEDAARDVPLAVIGMGRLGAEELTFASDLDVQFAYGGEGPDAFHEAGRAAERVMESVRAQGWAIDADLRPEGKAGPLARSLVSFLEYWERWAQTWEFQSLLRARVVGGDESLGRRFVANARDFAYPEVLTREQIVAVRRMRVRMEEERVRPKGSGQYNFKLGYGGLADVQFAVELALMRDGARHPDVRRTRTIEALEALAAERLIEDSVALSLSEAFAFLTSIKATLELERRIQAEALPATPEGQAALATRLGYEERGRHRFLQEYRRVTRRARLAMERVFYREEP